MNRKKAMIEQYWVWDLVDGKPKRIRVQQAMGLSRVKIKGQGWRNRSEYFNTEQEVLDRLAEPRPAPIPIYIKGLDY